MPAALEHSGGAVTFPIAKAVVLACKEARALTGAEVLTFPEGLADAFRNPVSEVLPDSEIIPHPEILPDPEVLPDPKILPDPQTDSSPKA